MTTKRACMTTKTNYKPCPRSWGDGYTAGYRQAIRDAAAILETIDNHSILPMTALDCARAIRELAPRVDDEPVKVPRLYQHTDGRYGLSFGPAKFAQGEPAWYSVPIDVYDDDGR